MLIFLPLLGDLTLFLDYRMYFLRVWWSTDHEIYFRVENVSLVLYDNSFFLVPLFTVTLVRELFSRYTNNCLHTKRCMEEILWRGDAVLYK